MSALGGCLLGGLSAPGESAPGGVCSWGVCCRGVSAPGGVCSWGGGIPACTEADPPVNRMTNRCKNITLATTSLWPVMIMNTSYNDDVISQVQVNSVSLSTLN